MIAFTLPGGVPVYAFSLMLALGASAGLTWVAWRSSLESSFENVNAGVWVLVGALIGARIFHVVSHWPYFAQRLAEAPQIFTGGLAWPGALAGGTLALLGFALLRRVQIAPLAASLLPLAVSLAVFAWLACWLDGYAYGRLLSGPLAFPVVDEWGVVDRRFPLQALGAVLALGGLALLDALEERLTAPLCAALGYVLLSIQLTALSALRVDPSPLWWGLRADVAAGIFLSICALGLLALAVLRAGVRPTTQPEPR